MFKYSISPVQQTTVYNHVATVCRVLWLTWLIG